MNKKLKKLISGIVSAALLGSSLVIPSVSAAVTAPTDYLVNLTFDESGTGSGQFTASKGGAVKENGTVAYTDGKEGKALNIASKSADNYLQLADGVLSGNSAVTYSFWFKAGSDAVPNWPFMTTCEDTHIVNTEKYLGMLATTSAFTMERYYNTDSRLSSISADSRSQWQYVTAVFEPNASKLYINGVLAASDSVAVNVAGVLTSSSKTWLGHANWGGGEGFSGMLDEFRIYGRALTDKEIAALAGDAYTEELEKIEEEKRKEETRKIASYEKLIIETHFYNKDNEEIYNFSKNTDTVNAEVKIKNYNLGDASVGMGVSKDGAKADTSKKVTIKQGEEYTFKAAVSGAKNKYEAYVTDYTSKTSVTYNAGTIIKADVVFPDASPEDTFGTTMAAHDPSIFKDPKTGTYYAYNTDAYTGEYTDKNNQKLTDTYPMDTFKSDDLVHWERIDNNFRVPASATAFGEEIYKPIGSNMNTGIWAPDIYYAEEDTEHPYWLYYSLSTNGSDYDYIRSLIGLVKGTSPTGPWTDCGVVISSQESYDTNAIDSNIYEDTNGDRYFIWGSFQKGIKQVKLTADGKAEGVDYSSNAAVHSTSKNVGVRLFSTPSGIMGPEGPYMVNNTDSDYRYMFTSYGWLGTNYNIRIARSSLSNTWDTETASQPHTKLLDHKNRKVGTTFADQPDKTELWGYKMLGSYKLGDGLTYYGNGHNSVLHDGDDWYLVEHCRKVPEGFAALQVRKMLWTDEGWPVVSPLVYAGEKEQTIPKEMIYGTWDLSSVGQYLTENNAALDVSKFANKQKVDLPVLSSQIILQEDGKIGDDLGTWTYDNDHTVTLKFEKDGNTYNNQYFKSGDTMKLFVLTGYDKDQRKASLVMTGTDQNSITQLAQKNNACAVSTDNTKPVNAAPVEFTKSSGSNPILGFDASGNLMYAGDPAAYVEGDTVYIYAGHDTADTEAYKMPEWVCYSSKNMTDWKYEGVVMKATDVSWRNDNTSAWASQVTKYGDKYYLYYCTWDKTSSGKQSIGVAVSDSPTGPFTDKGTPIVKGSLTEPQTSNWNDIDPTVWVETENGVEHRYLAWGNGIFYVCELNEDMISVKDMNGDGQIKMNDDVKQQEFTNLENGLGFTEAPWIYRQQDEDGNYTGKYYMFGAFGWREQMGYAVSDSMYGPWEFKGIIMPPTATSNTNHPSVIDFNGKTYFIYHNGALAKGSGFRRSVCVQELEFDKNGNVVPLVEMSTGLSGTDTFLIAGDGSYVSHKAFKNSSADSDYPISKPMETRTLSEDELDSKWEIVQGLSDKANKNYVSIQSVNKPGLYISAEGDGCSVVLTQNADGTKGVNMTFKTVKPIDGSKSGVSFESVMFPGKYLSASNGVLLLTKGSRPELCVFNTDAAAKPTDTPDNENSTSASTTSITVKSTVAGLTYTLYNSSNEVVETIVSQGGNISFKNLTKNSEYKLVVTDPDTGAVVAEETVKTKSSHSSGKGSSVQSTPKPSSSPAPEATDSPEATSLPIDELDTENHIEFVYGREDGSFDPSGSVTRAEILAMFARLYKGYNENEHYDPSFSDVENAAWYSDVIGFMQDKNIICGYGDGTFRPENNVTHAELASIAIHFTTPIGGDQQYINKSSESSWAKYYIAAATDRGWMSGDLNPDTYVTRADAVRTICEMTGRVIDADALNEVTGYKAFPDVAENSEYYYYIIEAANNHDHIIKDDKEIWTAVK